MSKDANAGELRTPVFFRRMVRTINQNGFPVETLVNVFGQDSAGKDRPARCRWVNAHGSETWTAMQLSLREPATITTRYSPALEDPTLLVYREADQAPYEIISIDNVEQKRRWLEIKVQRKEAAR